MYANVTAEATGRALATRLYHMTDDPGMKDMLSFLIARDTMHQQQWLAVLEELKEQGDVLPIPNSFPQAQENQEFNYVFLGTNVDPSAPIPEGRWTQGPSIDGKGEFTARRMTPQGEEPQLGAPDPAGFAQTQQMGSDGGLISKAVNKLTK
jgi:Mn-containing catalase